MPIAERLSSNAYEFFSFPYRTGTIRKRGTILSCCHCPANVFKIVSKYVFGFKNPAEFIHQHDFNYELKVCCSMSVLHSGLFTFQNLKVKKRLE